MTFLRDPFERVVAEYEAAATGGTLEEAVAAGLLRDNLQTRMLAGSPEPSGPLSRRCSSGRRRTCATGSTRSASPSARTGVAHGRPGAARPPGEVYRNEPVARARAGPARSLTRGMLSANEHDAQLYEYARELFDPPPGGPDRRRRSRPRPSARPVPRASRGDGPGAAHVRGRSGGVGADGPHARRVDPPRVGDRAAQNGRTGRGRLTRSRRAARAGTFGPLAARWVLAPAFVSRMAAARSSVARTFAVETAKSASGFGSPSLNSLRARRSSRRATASRPRGSFLAASSPPRSLPAGCRRCIFVRHQTSSGLVLAARNVASRVIADPQLLPFAP